jgi:DNA-binding transcriptional LysR family regulator
MHAAGEALKRKIRRRGMRNRNALPPLDLLVGFDSAARHLSFTKAGDELHLTQSAVSRQIKELEDQLGVALFERRHRALALTEAGQQFYAASAQALTLMRSATERVRAHAGREGPLSVTTTNSFASLWLIPRLASFTREQGGVDVRIVAENRIQDLDRDAIDVAIRYCPPALAGPQAVRLFGERVFPVCSPALARDAKRPLAEPADLRHHVLLRMDDPEGRYPWLSWQAWLEVAGLEGLRPAGSVILPGYEQLIPAAVAGQGVALGRSPLVRRLLAEGSLVAPFKRVAESTRAYFAVVSRAAAERAQARAFLAWLKREAAEEARR